MSRSSSQVRGLPRLSIADPSIPTRSYDEFRSSGLPASPSPHNRKASLDIRSSRSGLSRDASPHTHSRLPSLQMAPTFAASPGLPTSRTITQSSFLNDEPMRGRMHPDDLLADLQPPPPIGGSFVDRVGSPTSSRASSLARGGTDSVGVSSGTASRTQSPAGRPITPTSKITKKRTWLPGKSHGKSGSDSGKQEPWAFIVGTPEKVPYDLMDLSNGRLVPELYDDHGDLFVHLFGETQAPSFRLRYSAIESSAALKGFLRASRSRQGSAAEIEHGMRHMSVGSNASYDYVSNDGMAHLYIPLQFATPGELQDTDLENLVAIRNLFAFLVGQILVGTPKQPSLYAVFKNIAGLLTHYKFENGDNSSYGEVSTQNFLGYIEDLQLNDVRNNREKILEALVLGEMMKASSLYNEGYVHAVGKWDEIFAMRSGHLNLITPITRKRMEKSHMDLLNRLEAIDSRLVSFEFPSLFAGVAASTDFQKDIDIKVWRSSWVAMRKFTLSFYKGQYGDWPPRAKSKKNEFSESGLNRIVLQNLYNDLCDLYDMLVDKTDLTTRTADTTAHETLHTGSRFNRLRQLMSEFDRSAPPIKPPIPYDLCLLPDLDLVRRDLASLPEKKQLKERHKKLKPDDINLALMQSYNRDYMKVTPFLESYMAYERNTYHGKSIEEIQDLRIGQWYFLYVVLQSLPLVVIDAPNIRYTEGVEYFLCEAPKGTAPWLKDENKDRRYYRTGDGTAIASMPAAAVNNSVGGIYERSHCWQMAKIWSQGIAHMPSGHAKFTHGARTTSLASTDPLMLDDLPVPPSIGRNSWGSHSAGSSPRSSVALGLEELPLPPPIRTDVAGSHSRKASASNGTATFDDILGPASASTPTSKKKGWGSFSG